MHWGCGAILFTFKTSHTLSKNFQWYIKEVYLPNDYTNAVSIEERPPSEARKEGRRRNLIFVRSSYVNTLSLILALFKYRNLNGGLIKHYRNTTRHKHYHISSIRTLARTHRHLPPTRSRSPIERQIPQTQSSSYPPSCFLFGKSARFSYWSITGCIPSLCNLYAAASAPWRTRRRLAPARPARSWRDQPRLTSSEN